MSQFSHVNLPFLSLCKLAFDLYLENFHWHWPVLSALQYTFLLSYSISSVCSRCFSHGHWSALSWVMESKAGPPERASQSSMLHGWCKAQLCCRLDRCCTWYCFSVPCLLWSFFGPQTSLSYDHHILSPQGLLKPFVFYFRTLVLHFSIL